jgi:hypothetical protein
MDYENHLNVPDVSQNSSSKTKDENEESEEESSEKMPGFSNKHGTLHLYKVY